jgi:hypothetical protein
MPSVVQQLKNEIDQALYWNGNKPATPGKVYDLIEEVLDDFLSRARRKGLHIRGEVVPTTPWSIRLNHNGEVTTFEVALKEEGAPAGPL